MSFWLKFFLLVATISLLVLPSLNAYAQVTKLIGPCGLFTCGGGETFGGAIQTYFNDIVNVFVGLIGTVAGAFLVYAGYKYVMSFGNEEASATAKRQISYALIGIFVATSAAAIINLVKVPSAQDLIDDMTPIINALMALLGTVAIGFMVYAGFKYITSQGDESAAATAKRQIVYAIIGLFIAGSVAYVNSILAIANANTILLGARITLVVNALMALLAIVATGFLVYAGFKYVTSQGDESAAATAKRQILYAILGIFVGGSIAAANSLLNIANADTSVLIIRINRVVQAFEFLIGIVATFFLIISGVMYISSTGDESRAEQAKNQIIYAIIGIIVAGAARIISDTVFSISNPLLVSNLGPLEFIIRKVVNGFLVLVGTVAGIYMLIAGMMYLTSYGDEERARRAKMQVIYAGAGLAVITLSGVIVNFIIRAAT